eukprot:365333-Chlamydomonas_euryale.AAC.19
MDGAGDLRRLGNAARHIVNVPTVSISITARLRREAALVGRCGRAGMWERHMMQPASTVNSCYLATCTFRINSCYMAICTLPVASPLSSQARPEALQALSAPVLKPFCDSSSAVARKLPAAQLTSTSRRPNCLSTSATHLARGPVVQVWIQAPVRSGVGMLRMAAV